MLSITIPLWILLVGIGVPFVSLMALVIGLVRAKRAPRRAEMQKRLEASAVGVSQHPFTADMYKLLLDQQIDAIFLSLSTIIETEKLKLKTLITGQSLFATMDTRAAANQPGPVMDVDEPETSADLAPVNDVADQVGELSENGMTPKEIARDLGLSLSEVVLALRLNNTSNANNASRGTKGLGQKLEAVA